MTEINQEVWLKDGRSAVIVEKLPDKRFIVNPLIVYETEEGSYTEPSGSRIVVDEVMTSKPRFKVHEDLEACGEEMKAMSDRLRTGRGVLAQLQRNILDKQSELARGIVDMSGLNSAKRVTVFVKNSINPIERDAKKRLKLSAELSDHGADGPRCWAYTMYNGGSWSNGDMVDAEWGWLLDATDDEVLAAAKERSSSREWSDHELRRAYDKYLAPDMLKRKHRILNERHSKEVESAKADIDKAKARLAKLGSHEEAEA